MKFTVDKGKKRLDQFITEKLGNLSRSFISKLIKEGRVLVDSKIKSPGYVIKENDLIEINLDQKNPVFKSSFKKIDIYYEDSDVLVIEKPAGLLVHPASKSEEETVMSILRPKIKAIGGDRPGIVHRIDRDTSGLLIVARNPKAEENLKKQFKDRKVEKGYIALVYGHLLPKKGEINIPLDRSSVERSKRTVKGEGKEALTRYEVLEYLSYKEQEFTLVDVSILTGRTHQIRVHFEAIGHSLAGDNEYGNKKFQALNKEFDFKRQFLHAYRLGFSHPVTGAEMAFRSELPNDLKEILREFKN